MGVILNCTCFLLMYKNDLQNDTIPYQNTVYKNNFRNLCLGLSRKFVKKLKARKNFVKNCKGLPLFKSIFFKLLTSLSNKKSVQQIHLHRFKKRKLNLDFHLVGHNAVKCKIKLVFVGFLYTQVSMPVSLSLISTSRNGMVSEGSSTSEFNIIMLRV